MLFFFIFFNSFLNVEQSENTRQYVETANYSFLPNTAIHKWVMNPRKELANRGIDFLATPFAESIYSGDMENIELFLKGDMEYGDAQELHGEHFEEMLYCTETKKLSKSLKALVTHAKNTLDLSYLLLRSIYYGDLEKAKLFIRYGAKINKKNTLIFHSYVWRKITLEQATPLCFANARVGYFQKYPEKKSSIVHDFINIKQLSAINKYLVSLKAESSGNIITNSAISEPRYKQNFNCKTNEQKSIK